MPNRGQIINQVVSDFHKSFNTSNGFVDLVKVERGSIFSGTITQFPSLTIMFVSDMHLDGDYLDDTAMRNLTLELQVGVNTSSNNYEKFDELMDKCELFLRSDFISYDVILGNIVMVEGDKDVDNSFFSIQFSIFYDRQY